MTETGGWERRRILVWGKTRPEISAKHRELVCTGGVFADTKRLVRIYPLPLRYMESGFTLYQWVEAKVKKTARDPRPESYRIDVDTLEVKETISTENGTWAERSRWVLQDHNIFPSVEALQEQERKDGTSLGLVKPGEIQDITATRLKREEREKFWRNYREKLAQLELPIDPKTGGEKKPTPPPEYYFQIKMRCDDSRCNGHTFKVLDWGADVLYFKQKQHKAPERAAADVVSHLRDICSAKRDFRFFFGSILPYRQTFTIVGLWYPKVQPMDRLF